MSLRQFHDNGSRRHCPKIKLTSLAYIAYCRFLFQIFTTFSTVRFPEKLLHLKSGNRESSSRKIGHKTSFQGNVSCAISIPVRWSRDPFSPYQSCWQLKSLWCMTSIWIFSAWGSNSSHIVTWSFLPLERYLQLKSLSFMTSVRIFDSVHMRFQLQSDGHVVLLTLCNHVPNENLFAASPPCSFLFCSYMNPLRVGCSCGPLYP